MRGPLAVIRDRLAVDLASLAVALLAGFFPPGAGFFRAVMRGPRTAGRAGRAVLRGQGPRDIGAKTAEIRQFSKNREISPTGEAAQARAKFFTNNMVKNGMNVSRETLPIF